MEREERGRERRKRRERVASIGGKLVEVPEMVKVIVIEL